jgi:putative DNA primase/helicase
MWLRDGLNPPDAVKAATAAYRHESNTIMPFVESRCVVGGNHKMQARLAFESYEQFCRDEGVELFQRLSSKAFYKAVEQMFEKKDDRDNPKRTRQTFYYGVGLLAAATSTVPPLDIPEIDDSMAANPEETVE